MVEVEQVQDLDVEPADPGAFAPPAQPVDDVRRDTGEARRAQLFDRLPDRLGLRASSASVRPTHSTCAVDLGSGPRPAAAHASSPLANCAAAASSSTNGRLNSSANLAASAGVRLRPVPPTRTGMRCAGLGSAGESVRV